MKYTTGITNALSNFTARLESISKEIDKFKGAEGASDCLFKLKALRTDIKHHLEITGERDPRLHNSIEKLEKLEKLISENSLTCI